MEVIPGTHPLEQIPHRDTFAKDIYRGTGVKSFDQAAR